MKRRIIWLFINCLITLTLVTWSCGGTTPVDEEQEEELVNNEEYGVVSEQEEEEQGQQEEEEEEQSTKITTSGHITSDEIWSGTVHITGEIFIDEGVTVTILPGTTILIAAHQDDQHFGAEGVLDEYIAQHNDPTWTLEYGESHITIRGRIIARGTPENMITFTSDSPTPDAGDWQMLHVSPGSIFEYCIVEYCQGGIDLSEETGDSVLISHSIIRHILWTSIAVHSCSPTITYNEISQGGGHGGITVLGEQASPYIAYNTFTECKAGIGILEGASALVEYNEFIDNDTAGVGLLRANSSTIIRFNSISSPNGPSKHTTYQGVIIYPSYRLNGEYVSEGINVNESSGQISNNEIFECNNAGIVIMGNSSPEIYQNTIEGNNMGILFNQSFVGTPTIEMNNILNNENSNIALRAAGNIVVINNWWGTIDPEEIQSRIYNIQGVPAIGRAEFQPFLTEPADIDRN